MAMTKRLVAAHPDYRVSRYGRVESKKSGRWVLMAASGRVKGKYPIVHLCDRGKIQGRFVAHLVLEAFVGPRPLGALAKYLDGNPLNCRADNLAWVIPARHLLPTSPVTAPTPATHHYYANAQ